MAKQKKKQEKPEGPKKEKRGLNSISTQIEELKKEISTTKYNKKTQHHIGLVKAKLAKLIDKQQNRSSKKSVTHGYSVSKTGDSTVLLLGFPSAGKSTLLNVLTNANSEVGAYAFTTLDVVPGLMEYNHAKIQILDVPGIVKGAASGKGRGKEVLSVMRNANAVIMIVDVHHPEHLKVLKEEIYENGIRINQKKPDMRIKKTAKDGIRIGSTIKLTKITHQTIKAILKEFRINNADVLIRTDISVDQLIDCIETNKVYMPAILVFNKIDTTTPQHLEELKQMYNPDICISAAKKINTEKLKQVIFDKLDLMRIYLKEPSKPADMKEPLIIFRDATVADVCRKLHRDFVTKFRFARVTGRSAKFAAQKFTLKHKLLDEDILELHIS